jgi:hypothetical protein
MLEELAESVSAPARLLGGFEGPADKLQLRLRDLMLV